jgi:hypothetical protein
MGSTSLAGDERQLHDSRTAGHLGREKTLNNVRRGFYWPWQTADVSRWVQNCTSWARRKPGPGVGKSPLQHMDVGMPLQRVAIDIPGHLPETREGGGDLYIMVVGDYFTKWMEAYSILDHTGQTAVDKLSTEWITLWWTPQQIHTDQGREFESHLFAAICANFGVKKTQTSPYRPNSDGLVERFNRTVQQMLSMFVDEHRRDWDEQLPYVMMAKSNSP